MNRSEFLSFMRDPAHADRHLIGEVQEVIDLFPYFQSAHLLLLKNLHESGDVKFEKQLKSSAIHVADREVLYYLLSAPAAEETAHGLSGEIHQEEAQNDSAELHDTDTDQLQTVIESVNNSEDLIEEIEKDSGREEAGEEENDDNPDLIILSAIEDEPDADDVETELSSYSNMDLLELEPENSIDLAGEKEPESKMMSQSDLIDKFISANPRIEPVRDRTEMPLEDRSERFSDSGGFISETLAGIYISQGYYSRAIDIYEKLSLKYPKKSSYFATQIEKVKEYLKS